MIILDLDKGYAPEDLSRVVEPLIGGEADVVVATTCRDRQGDPEPTRPGSRPRPSWIGVLARPLIGITDPSSGLVAVTRASYQARAGHPAPLGSRFVLEMLVGSVGRRVEIPMRRRVQPRRVMLRPNDLRLIKRLVDDRFGNL
jgi:hypothetical protein